MPHLKLIEVSETPYPFISKPCFLEPMEISGNMGSAFDQVWRSMESEGITSGGGALSVSYDRHPERMNFRAGLAEGHEDLARAKGAVETDVIPTGQALHFVRKGSYSTRRDDYGPMMQHVESIGREVGAPSWEVSLNTPDEVPEEELLAEVFSILK